MGARRNNNNKEKCRWNHNNLTYVNKTDGAMFGLYGIGADGLKAYDGLWFSDGFSSMDVAGVRAVVSLRSDVTVTQ